MLYSCVNELFVHTNGNTKFSTQPRMSTSTILSLNLIISSSKYRIFKSHTHIITIQKPENSLLIFPKCLKLSVTPSPNQQSTSINKTKKPEKNKTLKSRSDGAAFSGGCRVQPIVTNPSAIIIKKIFFSI